MRGSEKPFKIRGVLARKTLHELEMYRTIPYTCSKKFEPKICPTCRRDASAALPRARRCAASSQRHPRRCAASSQFSTGGARRRGPYPRFMDATVTCERINKILRRPCPGRSAATAPLPRAGLCSCHCRIRGRSNWMPMYATTASALEVRVDIAFHRRHGVPRARVCSGNLSHLQGETSSAALPPPRAALCSRVRLCSCHTETRAWTWNC